MFFEFENLNLKKFTKREKYFFNKEKNILIIGICFHKSKLIREIPNLTADYIEENLEELEGNFAILYFKNNTWKVFLDYGGEIALYYYIDDKNIYISDLYYHILKKVPNFKINVKNLAQAISQSRAILSRGTVIEGIHRFKGGNLYSITFDHVSQKKILNSEVVKKVNIEREYDIYKLRDILQKKAIFIKENFKKIAICMTGGSDSRIILALFLSIGVKPTLLYGVGNSIITNTREEDYKIVKELAEKYELNLKIMNWNNSFNSEDDMEELLERYGEEYYIYGGNIRVFKEYEKLSQEYDFIEFGYFGETLRNLEIIDQKFVAKKRKMNQDDLYNIYINTIFIKKNKKNEYIKYMKEEVKNNIEERLNLNIKKFNEQDFNFFYREYRFLADTSMLNLLIKLGNSMSILSLYEIQNLLASIPVKEKENYHYMINLLELLYPSILEIPFFSHCQLKEYNSFNKSLVSQRDFYNNLKNLKNKFLNNSFGEKLKLIIFKFLFKNKKSRMEAIKFQEEKKFYLDYCKKNEEYFSDFIELNKIKNYPRFLIDLYMWLYMFERLKKGIYYE